MKITRFIISKERIDQRNSILESIQDEAYKIFKMQSARYAYVSARDFSISAEDLAQEFAIAYILQIDKKLEEDLKLNLKVDWELMKHPKMINSICQNVSISILRKIEAQKRGGSRNRDMDEFIHLDMVPEEFLTATMSEGSLVQIVVEAISEFTHEDFGVTETEWQLFIQYYVEGYTQQEMIDKGSTEWSQQYLSRKLKDLGNTILPAIKSKMEDLLITEEMTYGG